LFSHKDVADAQSVRQVDLAQPDARPVLRRFIM
jgi:hypothetical protein